MSETAYILGSGISSYIDAFQTDFGNPTDITASQIKDLLVKSMRRVNRKIGTTFSYFAVASGFSPTPTETQGDIILLQAECLFAKRRYSAAVSKGISVRDGDTSINTTSSFAGHRDIQNSICDELNDAIAAYKETINGAENYGTCVWYGNSNIIADHDHNGDASHSDVHYDSPFDD